MFFVYDGHPIRCCFPYAPEINSKGLRSKSCMILNWDYFPVLSSRFIFDGVFLHNFLRSELRFYVIYGFYAKKRIHCTHTHTHRRLPDGVLSFGEHQTLSNQKCGTKVAFWGWSFSVLPESLIFLAIHFTYVIKLGFGGLQIRVKSYLLPFNLPETQKKTWKS